MKTTILTILASVSLTCALAFASHEGVLLPDEMTLTQRRLDATAKIIGNEDRTVSITVTIAGKIYSVPKEILAGVKNVDLRSLKYIMHFPHGGEMPDEFFKGPFILSFDYGERQRHGRKDGSKTVRVFSRMRLHFSPARGYFLMERAVPQGRHTNQWKLTMWQKGGEEEDNGMAESVWCPWTG